MKKKLVSLLLAAVFTSTMLLSACGNNSGGATIETVTEEAPAADAAADAAADTAAEAEGDSAEAAPEGSDDYHIGIVTGSVSQSEDDRRGAEAFQAKYGEDRVMLATYPDNFTEELETTIQTIVNLSDDEKMKAIIVNQC